MQHVMNHPAIILNPIPLKLLCRLRPWMARRRAWRWQARLGCAAAAPAPPPHAPRHPLCCARLLHLLSSACLIHPPAPQEAQVKVAGPSRLQFNHNLDAEGSVRDNGRL